MTRARLPLDLTTFVGRAAELEQLTDLVGRSRLLTLTGGPGAGKTRLALELVRGRLSPERNVAWTELGALGEAGLVVPAIADALPLSGAIASGDVDALGRLIGDESLLLVLDNCEHLVDAAAGVADALLRACPGLSILATSREALGVRGERAWLVPALAVPAPEGADDAGAYEAVRLFVERAREVAPAFALTEETAPAVAEICRRLDGIPLAIELAAARMRLMSPGEVLARLDDVFQLLTDERRTVSPRHRTLRAAIDWSHDLLGEPARVLLRRLAVFRSGFTLGAAEQVGQGEGIGPEQVLDLVGHLVDRSMIAVREGHGFTRYHLLEAVRQYALEKLVASGEERDVRSVHARYFLRLAEEAEPHLTRKDRRAWVDRLQSEIDDLRSALDWSRAEDAGLHVRLAGRLWWFWFSTQHWNEGARWIDGALALPPETGTEADRASLLFAAGALAALQVRSDAARAALEEAASIAARLGDARLEAYALNYLGMTHAGEGDGEGMELCRRAEAWFRTHDDLYGLRLALLLQGSAALGRGALAEAERLNREGVEVARRFGQPRELAVSLQNLAVVLIIQERLDEAEDLVLEALRTSRQDLSYYFIATGIAYLAEIEGYRGRSLEAARLFGAAEALRERVGARPFPLDRRRMEALVARIREQAGPVAFDEAWATGRAASPERLLEELAERGPGVESLAGTRGGAYEEWGAGPEDVLTGGPEALVVEALGPFRAWVDGAPVDEDRWPYAKPRELLAFLLLHPIGRTRDQVGEALWPGSTPSKVKNSFHVTLHHLRKTLGHPEWIGVEGERYRLLPEVSWRFDAAEFETEGRRALVGRSAPALRSAIALYRGDLMEGEPMGRWLDEHRERLQRLYVVLSLALADLLEDDDPDAAAGIYRSLAAREELDEEIHRRLMTSLARAGDRVGALRHYDRLVGLLELGFDARPEPATRELYDRLRAGERVG